MGDITFDSMREQTSKVLYSCYGGQCLRCVSVGMLFEVLLSIDTLFPGYCTVAIDIAHRRGVTRGGDMAFRSQLCHCLHCMSVGML